MTTVVPLPADGYAGDLTPKQAHALLASDPTTYFVDVRTEAEWRAAGVADLSSLGTPVIYAEWLRPGGVRNPDFVAELRAAGVCASGRAVFLCRAGVRSAAAARAMSAAGIEAAYNIVGGFEGSVESPDGPVPGWRASGMPSRRWRGR